MTGLNLPIMQKFYIQDLWNKGRGWCTKALIIVLYQEFKLRQFWFSSENHPKLLVLFSPPSLLQYSISHHISSCRLQWRVTAVMLADTLERYRQQEKSLLSDFEKLYPGIFHRMVENDTHGSLVQWVERSSPRRYGCFILLGIFFNSV